jgi:1-acyl-sn-glycerol-3-phosphate acyltransferase
MNAARWPVGAWRLARALLHVLHGIAVVALHWRALDAAARHARIGWWAAKLLRLLGVRLEAGRPVRSGATLLAANHVSWLDILAIHAVCPRARFVSKAEVRHWPLLGWLIGAVGTLFIERGRKRDALRVVHQVAQALRDGGTVAVFPEGTTGAGPTLLPFHANLLQAAISTATPVQPVVLRYAGAGERFSTAVAWLDDATLLDSVWAIVCARGLVVHVDAPPPLASVHAERRALAERLRETIGDVLDGR